MKRVILICALFLLQACGGSSGGGDSNPTTEGTTSQASSSEVSAQKVNAEQFVKVSANLVLTAQDLSECEDKINGALTYIKDEEKFVYCESPGAGWVDIDLKGKDGSNGTNGANGADGQDATQKGEWINPVNKKHYFLWTPKAAINGTDATCPSGSSLVDGEEVLGAYWHFDQTVVLYSKIKNGVRCVGYIDKNGIAETCENNGSYNPQLPLPAVICRLD